MLCPGPTPLNRRPTVQNLLNPHRAPSREAGSFVGYELPFTVSRFAAIAADL